VSTEFNKNEKTLLPKLQVTILNLSVVDKILSFPEVLSPKQEPASQATHKSHSALVTLRTGRWAV
jgi:hypothetical protein